MQTHLFPSALKRRAAFTAVYFAVVTAGSWMVPHAWTQSPAATTSNAALAPFLAKIKTQQEQAAANQAKIEAQTAQLKEEVRQLKIYAARAGSKR